MITLVARVRIPLLTVVAVLSGVAGAGYIYYKYKRSKDEEPLVDTE